MKGKARVLIVDDEESIRFNFEHFLIQAGYDVEAVSSVEDAKSILAGVRFDVAVIDTTFPGLSG